MPHCPFCGAGVRETDRNCSSCGALLEWDGDAPLAEHSAPTADLPGSDQEIVDLAKNQGKIAAIKRYREVHRVGLKEAKDRVEALMSRHGIVAAKGRGCATVLLFAAAAAWAAVTLVNNCNWLFALGL